MKKHLILSILIMATLGGQAQTWTNTISGNWSAAANWDPNTLLNDGTANASFNLTNSGITATVDVAYDINSLTLDTNQNAPLTLSGAGPLTIQAGGITNLNTPLSSYPYPYAHVINAPLSIGASQTWNMGTGGDRQIRFNGAITGTADKTITVASAQNANQYRKFVVGANSFATLASSWVVDAGGRVGIASSAGALGTGPVRVNSGGQVGCEGGSATLTNNITLAGGALGGMGDGNAGPITGNINIISNSFINHSKGASGMVLAGGAASAISGSGNLTVVRPTGVQTYTLKIGDGGSFTNNINTGTLYIQDGQIVQLEKRDSTVAWGGNIVVNSGQLRNGSFREDQIGDTATVTINPGGTWNLEHGLVGNAGNQQYHEKIAGLVVNASVNAFINDYSTPDPAFAGPAVKARLVLGGAAVSGLGAEGIFALTGGTLSGTGIVNKETFVVDGTLAPGVSGAGTLGFSTNLTVEATALCDFDVSTAAASGNDKITVGSDLVINGTPALRLTALSGAAALDTGAPYVLGTVAGTITGSFDTTPTWVGTPPSNAGLFNIVTDGATKEIRLQQGIPTVPTTTSVGSSLNPSEYSQSVTFTATVSPGAATGTVTFKNGGVTIGTGALSGGSASLITTVLALGSHSITAEYGGDSTYIGSASSALLQVVNAKTTGTTTAAVLTSSANPSEKDSSVTFTATVDQPSATGWVQFKDGASVLATVVVSGGTANYSTALLAVGPHSMTAVYSGDTTFAGSIGALSQSVVITPTLFTYEGFTNALGTQLFSLNGGTGWSSVNPTWWYIYNGNQAFMYITNAGLSYPANINLTPTGDELILLENTTLERLARDLGAGSKVVSGTPATRYLSFLIRVSGSFPENAYTSVGLGKVGDNDANIYFNINTFQFKIDVDSSFGASSTGSTSNYPAANTTYFVVLKFTSGVSGNYQAFAKVYDAALDTVADGETDPGFGWDITSPTIPSNGLDLSRLVVRHGLNVVELDEIRIGNTWSSVALTYAASPVSLSITPAGSNVIVSWPAWATGYTLYSSTDVTTPIGTWTSEGVGSIVGPNYQVTLPTSVAAKFFRLVK